MRQSQPATNNNTTMQKSDFILRFPAKTSLRILRLCPDYVLKTLPILFLFLAVTTLRTNAQTVMAARQTPPTAGHSTAGQPTTDTQPTSQPSCPTFGYLSYDSVLHAMPAYATVMRQLDELKAKYEAEAKRVESDFNKKYEEFLEGQRDFPQTILQKRQSELQELLDRNILFREESRRLLTEAERGLLAPLHARIAGALRAIGEERGYAFIINTDGNACPFINPTQGENISSEVSERLR